jgi:polyhydroxyalkanoate synthesis regulator phasin
MTEAIDNLVLEHLKKIQAEQTTSRERDAEMLSRLAHIETSIARLARDGADNFAEAIADRHAIDKLKERIDRLERRLELQN